MIKIFYFRRRNKFIVQLHFGLLTDIRVGQQRAALWWKRGPVISALKPLKGPGRGSYGVSTRPRGEAKMGDLGTTSHNHRTSLRTSRQNCCYGLSLSRERCVCATGAPIRSSALSLPASFIL